MPQAATATQDDTSFLEKYKAQAGSDDTSFLEKYRAPKPEKVDQGTIGPTPSWKPGDEIRPLETIENYTQEGRKAHPILSRIGDASRNLKEMLRIVGPEIGLLSGAPGGLNPAGSPSVPSPEIAPVPPKSLTPIKRAPEEVFQRPIEPAPGAGKGAPPAEMHPEELAAIRKEAGNPALSPEDAHRFRINQMASAAAATKPVNLGGLPRAGEAAPTPIPTRLPTLFEKGTRPNVVKIEDLVNQAAGVKSLKPDVPLREQLTGAPEVKPIEPVDPIKAKYPDPAVRQMVRANGERIYEATKHDPNLVKAIHDLTRVDLRQALVNAGEDMGQMTVSNSKFAGEGSIPREEAFNRLLEKGLKPEKIVQLAKQKSEVKELPAQPRLPDTGMHAAIKTDDGGIYFDDAPEKQRTHIMLAKDLGIPPERVVSGGWLKDGEYEGSVRSDAGRWGEQARAQAAVAGKRAAREAEPEVTPEARTSHLAAQRTARERAARIREGRP